LDTDREQVERVGERDLDALTPAADATVHEYVEEDPPERAGSQWKDDRRRSAHGHADREPEHEAEDAEEALPTEKGIRRHLLGKPCVQKALAHALPRRPRHQPHHDA